LRAVIYALQGTILCFPINFGIRCHSREGACEKLSFFKLFLDRDNFFQPFV
jgi:hypothetical protein